jgi:pyruvate/2-oxoglutarate dehydrogenase complex dihydrolipoamide acyltransferase (E2) component
MAQIVEVKMPRYPDCWETCGNCGNGEVFVLELLVQPGETIRADDNLLTIETGKVALDIPSPYAGRIMEMRVKEGEYVAEGAVIATVEVA